MQLNSDSDEDEDEEEKKVHVNKQGMYLEHGFYVKDKKHIKDAAKGSKNLGAAGGGESSSKSAQS